MTDSNESQASIKAIEAELDAAQEAAMKAKREAEEALKSKVREVIQLKKDEVNKAKAEVREAQKVLARLENELIALQRRAGMKSKVTSSGNRKPRVSNDTKREQVAKVLEDHPKIQFSKLKVVLLDLVDPETEHPYFSQPDFASSKVFAQKYLPQGFKVEGERRDAVVVPA